MVKVDRYRVVARFARLFPDPAVFEDQDHLVERYLVQNGLLPEKTFDLYQGDDEINPVDDSGKPAVASGTASFRFQGKNIIAEFMPNASLTLEYYDFGTGLSPEDHSRLWKKQRIGEMAFQIRDFAHEIRTLNVTNVSELYEIMKKQSQTTSLSRSEKSSLEKRLTKESTGSTVYVIISKPSPLMKVETQ